MGHLKNFHTENLHYKSEEDDVRVYRDDSIAFLSKLPKESVDTIVTDPAYSGMNQKMKFGNGRIVGEYQKEGNGKWFQEFHDTEENYRKFLEECRRVMKKRSHIYIMFDSFSLLTLAPLIREYFDVKNIITWDKVNLGMGHYFRRRHEFILFATKGYKKLNSRALPDVWRFKRVHRADYPTQKPVEVFEAMLVGSVEPKKSFVVCDPFLGSGSSAIAALKKGCSFIGSDIDKKAVFLSKERISHFKMFGKDKHQTKNLHIGGEKIFWR